MKKIFLILAAAVALCSTATSETFVVSRNGVEVSSTRDGKAWVADSSIDSAPKTETFTGIIHNYTMWGEPGYGKTPEIDSIENVLLFVPDDRSKSMILVFKDSAQSKNIHEWDAVQVTGSTYERQTDLINKTKFLSVESIRLTGRNEQGKTILLKDGKRTVTLHQADYDRTDLVYVMGTGNGGSLNNVYKIEGENLLSQKSFTESELERFIKRKNLRAHADYLLQNGFGGLWKDKLYFYRYELLKTDKDNAEEKRNDWVIEFEYQDEKYRGDDTVVNEAVFMLPDGTIIISATNCEQIKGFTEFPATKNARNVRW